MPVVLALLYKHLYMAPPRTPYLSTATASPLTPSSRSEGSVLLEASAVTGRLLKNGGWRRCMKGGDTFWDSAKPTQIEAAEGALDTKKVFWDDKFVDELRQSFSACKVFLLIPVSGVEHLD